ncbi:MAG: HesA/MoeB/ThiF family protein [Bacteroidota bacterium]|nr:HesA/MoeB/ThiF family protein [Bacteroidota bacterium]
MTEEELQRYSRHVLLPDFGTEGQEKLKQASVLVVGCGGLGSPVLQYLVAAGVGTIGMIDADVVSESNLQRQILYATSDVGKLKVLVAKEKLSALNPLVVFHAYPFLLTSENAREIIDKYDIITDCSDNFNTRFLVGDVTAELKKPLVFGSIFQYEGQASVFNYKGGPTYRQLFPEAPENVLPASQVGVLGVLPGIIGVIQATEVVKIVAEIGEVLSGKLLMYNVLDMSFKTFKFSFDTK